MGLSGAYVGNGAVLHWRPRTYFLEACVGEDASCFRGRFLLTKELRAVVALLGVQARWIAGEGAVQQPMAHWIGAF